MRTISPISIAALRALLVDFLRRGLPATPLTRPGFAPYRLIVLEEVYYG
jgi:hypothetical protein